MKKLIIGIALIVTLGATQAADVTLTYTPLQLKAVQRLVARMNAEKVAQFLAQNPDGDTNTVQTVTVMGWVQALFTAKLDAVVAQEKKLIQAEIAAKYEEADAATQAEVEAHLSVTP